MNQTTPIVNPIKVYTRGGDIATTVREWIGALTEPVAVAVDSIDDAHLIITDDINLIGECNRPGKMIGLIVADNGSALSHFAHPENFVLIDGFAASFAKQLEMAFKATRNMLDSATDGSVETKAKLAGALNILVVDDGSENIRTAAKLAEKHNLTTATNCADAIACLAENRFDVVLTDLRMPMSRNDLRLGSLGVLVVIEAARVGVKRIVVYTDTNHHPDPLGIALVDRYGGALLGFEDASVQFIALQDKDGGKDWELALKIAQP